MSMEVFKKNKVLFLGLSVPILMIIFVVASIYIPMLFIKPKYNFIYTASSYYGQQYVVRDSKIVKDVYNAQNYSSYYDSADYQYPVLYYYDVSKDESKEISFDETKTIELDSSKKSLDGFEISSSGSGGGFMPFMYNNTDYSSIYIKGNGVSKKLNLRLSSSDYYDFHLIGWVK